LKSNNRKKIPCRVRYDSLYAIAAMGNKVTHFADGFATSGPIAKSKKKSTEILRAKIAAQHALDPQPEVSVSHMWRGLSTSLVFSD
jgi:hypothetical protein